jgi:ABC-type multidrug transport system fused ATPase/permease subunit
MTRRFLARLWPLLPSADRRRVLLGAVGAALLALLDALGILLVFPLTQLVASLDSDQMPSTLDGLADAVGITDPGTLAAWLAAAVVACFVTKGILALVLLRSTVGVALDAEAAVAGRLMAGYLSAPLEFHLHRNSADLQRTLHESTRRVYQEGLVTAVPSLGDRLILVLVSIVLLVIAPVEALVGGLFMLGLVAFYRRLTARRAQASSDELVEQGRRSIQYVQQALSAVREIQVAGREQRFANALLEVREGVAQRQRTLTLTELLARYYLELGIVIGAGLVGATAYARNPPDRATALLALFLAASLRLLPSLNRVLVAETKARVALPNLERLVADLDELDQVGPLADDATPLAADAPFEHLQLDGVALHYRGQEVPAIDDVDLRIERGERLVFVGRSGSGKTTALNVLLGFLPPTSGEVRVDGIDLRSCLRSWRDRLAYVPQDVVVLDASVADNVALGVPPDEIDRDRVRDVLRSVQLDGFVATLPDGIDSEVGEGGSRMSGGQRQRLGLARALYQGAEVLVLDEATSALDATTESFILDLLDALAGDLTIVAVAHRQAAIERFGRVVLFEDGRIVADGSVDELRDRRPSFDALVSSLEADPDVARPAP